MWLTTALLGALAVFSGVVSADASDDLQVIADAAALYPACAFECLTQLVPQSECSPTDVECLCTNKDLTKDTEECILHGCTIEEGLQTQNITMTMCGAPVRDKHLTPLVIALTGGSLALLSFIMRLCTLLNRTNGRSIGADDYMAGAAVLLAAPPTLTAFHFRDNGLGKDIWTLEMYQIENVLMLYYLGSVFYIASITMVKMSLVCFILRVFPDKKFRMICYGIEGLVVAYGISFTTATALQCWPAEYAWKQIYSDAPGTCNNIHLQAWLAAVFNIILDLILLALPLGSLWRLNMGLKKKLMVMAMFSLGVFVTIISVVRLHTLIKFANSKNITWDYVEAGYWSLVEMHASIICTCLPYCRHLLISLGANFLQSTKAGDSRAYGSRAATSRKGSQGAVLSVHIGKNGESQQSTKPVGGDERDFVPLVEYPDRSWDKNTTVSAVSAANTSHSRDSV